MGIGEVEGFAICSNFSSVSARRSAAGVYVGQSRLVLLPRLALSGRAGRRQPRPLLGVKRTSQLDRAAAANDPMRTFAVKIRRNATKAGDAADVNAYRITGSCPLITLGSPALPKLICPRWANTPTIKTTQAHTQNQQLRSLNESDGQRIE